MGRKVNLGLVAVLWDTRLLCLEAALPLHPGETQVLTDISLAALVANSIIITQWIKTAFSHVASSPQIPFGWQKFRLSDVKSHAKKRTVSGEVNVDT